jgi:hypothetical protein
MSRLSFRVLIGNYLRNKGSEIWSIACPMLNADSKFGEVWGSLGKFGEVWGSLGMLELISPNFVPTTRFYYTYLVIAQDSNGLKRG